VKWLHQVVGVKLKKRTSSPKSFSWRDLRFLGRAAAAAYCCCSTILSLNSQPPSTREITGAVSEHPEY
jgi:hypothetical protein